MIFGISIYYIYFIFSFFSSLNNIIKNNISETRNFMAKSLLIE